MPFRFAPPSADATLILPVSPQTWSAIDDERRRQAESVGFVPKAGRHCLLPSIGHEPAVVLFGVAPADDPASDPFAAGRLATLLPASGPYAFASGMPDVTEAALSWALSSYRFTRFKRPASDLAALCGPEGIDIGRIERVAAAVAFGRDLVNTPANHLGPEALTTAALEVAHANGASVRVIAGNALATGFPLVHAVGQAAHEAPRLVDITWGAADAPAVTLVGKGVTFDTGGLNIKPDAGMLLMKKDMGGAAAALSLARFVMESGLGLRLRVILPIVENAISAASFRPGDIIRSRKGPTVEIGNTDAEGRLILADALALAGEDKPDLLVDFATLTGAARVALGPDLPPFFTDDEALAAALAAHGRRSHDPVWRLPLWSPYDALLDGKAADINNVGGTAFGGSIVAALFLRRFVAPGQSWVHFDIFGWNPTAKAGRPEGGEVQTVRLLADYLEQRYPPR